jgi:hypothetical protein
MAICLWFVSLGTRVNPLVDPILNGLRALDFFEKFLTHLATRYPATAKAYDVPARLSPLLICPDKIQLSNSLRTEAEKIVSAFWTLRNFPQRNHELENLEPAIPDPGNVSALMSYDFHVDASGQLRLIEINTNASLSLLVELLYEVHGIENPFSKSFRDEIIATFREELKLAGVIDPKQVAIVDERPQEQRLFIEFLMYKELFEKSGFTTHIADAIELQFVDRKLQFGTDTLDLIYNRHTDFYFQNASTSALHKTMISKAACISPHPHDYRLLADKERLMELSRPQAIENQPLSPDEKFAIEKTLIRTLDVREFCSTRDPQELWKERKKWFFKPKRSFGGKATYRGSSVTHPTFAQIIAGEYLAQEFVAAPVVKTPASGEDGFKYDLRFYTYKQRIQLSCARLYRGQMTNSQTLGGGITAIEWV